jgi:hypothetical protein
LPLGVNVVTLPLGVNVVSYLALFEMHRNSVFIVKCNISAGIMLGGGDAKRGRMERKT